MTLVSLRFSNSDAALLAAFNDAVERPAVSKTCCISVLVWPDAPFAAICNAVAALYGETKTLAPGCCVDNCFSNLKEKVLFAIASLDKSDSAAAARLKPAADTATSSKPSFIFMQRFYSNRMPLGYTRVEICVTS